MTGWHRIRAAAAVFAASTASPMARRVTRSDLPGSVGLRYGFTLPSGRARALSQAT